MKVVTAIHVKILHRLFSRLVSSLCFPCIQSRSGCWADYLFLFCLKFCVIFNSRPNFFFFFFGSKETPLVIVGPSLIHGQLSTTNIQRNFVRYTVRVLLHLDILLVLYRSSGSYHLRLCYPVLNT